jgi:hypothetical protein
MKKLLFTLALSLFLLSCGKDDTTSESETFVPCGKTTSGQQLYKGSKGGCYYINSNNNKTYVERSECNC